jgi:hypothetical protein
MIKYNGVAYSAGKKVEIEYEGSQIVGRIIDIKDPENVSIRYGKRNSKQTITLPIKMIHELSIDEKVEKPESKPKTKNKKKTSDKEIQEPARPNNLLRFFIHDTILDDALSEA